MDQNFDIKKPTHLIALFLVLFILVTIPLTVLSVINNRDQRSQAANTSAIYLQPATQNVNVNTDFSVQVRENSGTTAVTTVDITLTYDPARLEYRGVDPTQTTDPFSSDAQVAPPITNQSGTITFVKFINPGSGTTPLSVTGDKFIATVRFRTKTTPGATTVTIANPASVVYGVNGTDETSTRGVGTFTVVDPPPTVSMTAPASNSHLRQTVTLSADATDNIGVVRVEFYDGATLIGTDTTAAGNSYAISWNTTTATNASRNLTARAFDANGSTTSSPVNVTVDNLAPTAVTISGLAAKVKGSVAVSATATDTNLDRIEFRVDSGATVVDNASPYSTNVDTTLLTNGTHTMNATAFDRAGNQTLASQTFTVDNQGPTAASLSGVSNTETTVNLSWTASTDALSAPVTYDVYRNGVKLTSTPISTTTYQVTGLTPSTAYTFLVKSIDTMANSTDSNTISVTTKAPPKLGDVNLDGAVNSADLAILLTTWGSTTDLRADINLDGRVSSADLAVLISRWGT